MYKESCEKIDSHFNIIKIINDLKSMKILMKHSLMTPHIKSHIEHSSKNIIYLSSSSSDLTDPEDHVLPEEVKGQKVSLSHLDILKNL